MELLTRHICTAEQVHTAVARIDAVDALDVAVAGVYKQLHQVGLHAFALWQKRFQGVVLYHRNGFVLRDEPGAAHLVDDRFGSDFEAPHVFRGYAIPEEAR
jgi:hypothetical protein